MSTYRIVIDGGLCSGFGTCAEMAPELFDIGPDGIAASRQGTTDDPAVLDVAAACPMGAISVVDE
jgi:ferredoxin